MYDRNKSHAPDGASINSLYDSETSISICAKISPESVRLTQDRFVMAFTDLDGTAVDETIPEKDRIHSIGPAVETVEELQNAGIPVGIITGRSAEEALYFQNLLGSRGPVICEDGAVVLLPPSADISALQSVTSITSVRDMHAAVLSRVDVALLNKILMYVERLSGESLIHSLGTVEDLHQSLGFDSLEAAERSAGRVASAYVVSPTWAQLEIIHEQSLANGVRVFSSTQLPHLIGVDANKGAALRFIDKHVHSILGAASSSTKGMLPIVFGNNDNDVSLIQEAIAMRGCGVLVPRPDGDYWVDPKQLPSEVILASEPCGHGMKSSLPRIFQYLNSAE